MLAPACWTHQGNWQYPLGGTILTTFLRNRSSLLFSAFVIIAAIIVVLVLALPRFFQAYAVHTIGGTAPNNDRWTNSTWAPSNNTILGTAQNTASDVWFTGSNGIIGEIFYPTADTPNTTALQFLIGDSSHTWVNQEKTGTIPKVRLYNNHSLAWIVTNTAKNGDYQLTKIIYTDPARNSVVQQVTFKALQGHLADYLLYVYYDPAIHNKGDNNNSYTKTYQGKTMLATYVTQWNGYDDSLRTPPTVGSTPAIQQARQQEYYLAANVLKTSQDKQTGAFVAGLGTPWGESNGDQDSGGYHLVWERDMYEFSSALIIAGDTVDPKRVLLWAFTKQQQTGGLFPQNSYVDGTPYFSGIQMDEQAFPIMLAWKLGITDKQDYLQHIKPTADLLVKSGGVTGQERWEENGGHSPSTLAAMISGLVCAAAIARVNDDAASQQRYLSTADYYRKMVIAWTYTTTGPLGNSRYFERIDSNGNPNDAAMIQITNSGGSYDERSIVDMGFLELVRQGIYPANSPYITSSLPVVDATIEETINGNHYWHRYNHDGYGEHANGSDYDGSGIGQLWPLLSGERGIYEVAAGQDADQYLTAMMAAANSSGMIPEQIWSNDAPAGYMPGTLTKSMNPLNWAMGEYITLLFSISEHRIADVVPITSQRYTGQ